MLNITITCLNTTWFYQIFQTYYKYTGVAQALKKKQFNSKRYLVQGKFKRLKTPAKESRRLFTLHLYNVAGCLLEEDPFYTEIFLLF